jgi:hypothetical protein
VTEAGLGQLPLRLLGEAELDRRVAVGVGAADRGHPVRGGLDHGHGHRLAIFSEELGHSDLFSEDGGHEGVA